MMTQEEIDTALLEIQNLFSYQNDQKLIEPSKYGVFNNELLSNFVIQNQILKALWRYNVDSDLNCSCLKNEQVESMINFLKNNIKTEYVAPEMPITTTFKNNNMTFCFNLPKIGCTCIGDYKDIRISLYYSGEDIQQYVLSEGTVAIIDAENVAVVLFKNQLPFYNSALLVRIEVMDTLGTWLTIVQDEPITIIKSVY